MRSETRFQSFQTPCKRKFRLIKTKFHTDLVKTHSHTHMHARAHTEIKRLTRRSFGETGILIIIKIYILNIKFSERECRFNKFSRVCIINISENMVCSSCMTFFLSTSTSLSRPVAGAHFFRLLLASFSFENILPIKK